MILDLNAFLDETLDIHMAGGVTLRIPKPSQKMLIKIVGFQNIDEQTPPEKVEEALNDMTTEILNGNIDGVTIKAEDVRTMSAEIKLTILNAYTDFMRKAQQNPTMPSRRSRARKGKKGILRFFQASGK